MNHKTSDVRQLGSDRPRRIVVGITGATGIAYGVRALQVLAAVGIETHLILSRSGALTLGIEGSHSAEEVRDMASVVHSTGDIGATIASGSFRHDGMLVAPCSMKTLSGIVNSYADNLIIRAADVTLKERRPLVLAVRETPLHLGHLRLMAQAAEIGAVIYPPVPAFYASPTSIDDLVDATVVRMLDQFGFELDMRRWEGTAERLSTHGEGGDGGPGVDDE